MPLPTIPSGNVFSSLPTGFNVDNSCRFNKADGAFLSRTSGTSTDTKKFTMSFWIKRCQLGTTQLLFYSGTGGTANGDIDFLAADTFQIYERDASSVVWNLKTNRVFRDTSAWYNIIIAADSTQGTAANRVKMYVNGVQETSFAVETYPAEDTTFECNASSVLRKISKYVDAATYFGDWYLSEFVFIDGLQLAATSFGEFDEDSPTIWKPIDVSGLTFGTNGFYLDFADSGDLGDDESGNTNDWTETNLAATDQATDTPTNNFCTLNPLNNMASLMVITDGNLHKHNQPTNNYWRSIYGTMGASSGKWYYEMLITNDEGTDVGNIYIGIIDADQMDNNITTSAHFKFVTRTRGYGYFGQDGSKQNNGSLSSFGNTWGNGDRMGCAFDLDNNKIYFSKNGTWENSGDPTSGATGTGSAYDLASGYTYLPALGVHYGNSQFDLNFGSPMAAISSGNADGNGYGNMEYAIPSGYYCLNTKNLAEFG